jgi:excisionase family DNA binding protein
MKSMAKVPSESWSTIKDVTEHLGVSRESILKWIAARNLPAHKLGKLWRFRMSEVDNWLESGQAGDFSSDDDEDAASNDSKE